MLLIVPDSSTSIEDLVNFNRPQWSVIGQEKKNVQPNNLNDLSIVVVDHFILFPLSINTIIKHHILKSVEFEIKLWNTYGKHNMNILLCE